MTSIEPRDPSPHDWRRDMSSSQSLEIQDDASLRFVCAVVSQHLAGSVVAADERVGNWRIRSAAKPRLVVYVYGMEAAIGLLWPLLVGALGAPVTDGAAPLEPHALSNGSQLRVIDVDKPEGPTLGARTGAESGEIILVRAAPVVGLPPPDLAIAALISPSKRSTKRKPYLLDLFIQDRGMHALSTALLPKYWSLHPAYEVIRTARRQRDAKT